MNLLQSAPFLLLTTGALLGLTLPFGKIAAQAGIAPAMWAFLISAGAGGVLFTARRMTGKTLRIDGGRLRYYFITAAISYALPNLMILTVIPHLGAGFTGIMYTLSPVVTLLMSVAMRLRSPNMLGVAGVAVGFVGATLVAMTRGEVGNPAEPLWLGIALLIPVLLAFGNIYRTMDWPKGADPIELAAGSHLASALLLFIGVMAFGGGFPVATYAAIPWISLFQVLAAAGMFALYFQLQAVGGPVYLSQMGYVAAALGLISGTLFLDEQYQLLTWIGALVICAGVAMTTRAQRDLTL